VILPLGAAGFTWLRLRWKRRAAERWVLTNGRVEAVTIPHKGDSVLPNWIVETAYSCQAGGEWHSGFASMRRRTEAQADALAAQLRNRTIMLRCDPNAAGEAVPE
jgi:hypothetical protein